MANIIEDGIMLVNYFNSENNQERQLQNSHISHDSSWLFIDTLNVGSPSKNIPPLPLTNVLLKKDNTIHCHGTIEGDLITSANKVYLLSCQIFGAVLFIDENKNPFQGLIVMDEESSILQIEKTKKNASIITTITVNRRGKLKNPLFKKAS